MELPRRGFLHLAAGAVTVTAFSRDALALDYPMRPVHIIVGYPRGGVADISARLIARWLAERLTQSFIVENQPGVANIIATQAVVEAAADGYTLLLAGTTNAINATLYDNLSFTFVRDIAPVAGIGRAPYVMVVDPSLPAKTVQEFIAYAKANSGKICMASAGVGSVSHMSGELFKMMAGVSMAHVPYHGQAPALTALLGGQAQVAFSTITRAMEYVKADKLRALAVTSLARFVALPDVPAMAEYLPAYEASMLTGLGAPTNTPAEIIAVLNKETNNALSDQKIKAQLAALGDTVLSGSPADFGRLMAEETDKWTKVIKFANIKPE